MSAGLDYYAGMHRPEQHRPTWRTCPEKCADHGHPGCTYNPQMNRTWCLCGEVVRDGNQLDPTHPACCDGALTERIETRHATTEHAGDDERMCDNRDGRRGVGSTADGLTRSSGTSREGL